MQLSPGLKKKKKNQIPSCRKCGLFFKKTYTFICNKMCHLFANWALRTRVVCMHYFSQHGHRNMKRTGNYKLCLRANKNWGLYISADSLLPLSEDQQFFSVSCILVLTESSVVASQYIQIRTKCTKQPRPAIECITRQVSRAL